MDPRITPLQDRLDAEKKSQVSTLMRAKSKAGNKQVNACPYGCKTEHLDQSGYCRHLVGFTTPGDPGFGRGDPQSQDYQDGDLKMEPMVRVEGGRRAVRVKMVPDKERSLDDENDPIMKPVLDPVLKGDRLEQITTSWRVYRDVKVEVKQKKA